MERERRADSRRLPAAALVMLAPLLFGLRATGAPSQVWGDLDSDSLRACQAAVRDRAGVDVRAGDAYTACLHLDFLEPVLRVWPWLEEHGVGVGRPLYLFFDDPGCAGGLMGIASASMHLNLEQVPYGVDDAIGSVLIVHGRAGQMLEAFALAPPHSDTGSSARIDVGDSVGLFCVPSFEATTDYGPVAITPQAGPDGASGDLDDIITYIRTSVRD